jgi:hypothetical protein
MKCRQPVGNIFKPISGWLLFFPDITRPNIGNSILQPITLEADLRTADNSVNYSRASISKPLALDIDPKIKTNIWALEYIDLSCLLNKKQSKVKFQPTETSEGGMAFQNKY